MTTPLHTPAMQAGFSSGFPRRLARAGAMFGAALVAFGAACGGSPDAGDGEPSDRDDDGEEREPEREHPEALRFAGLMHLDGLEALPAHTEAEDSPYSASWRLGAFEDEASLEAFADAADVALEEDVDWSREFVLFAVFDGQTNRLRDPRVEVDESAREVTLYFERDGIEPHYAEETPVVLHAAPRDGIETVRYVSESMPAPGAETEIGVWSPTGE